MDIIGNVYKSFLKAGFSPKQAKALTAEVGRENNFNSKYVYGSHQDAANNKTNVGFFSWQGERGKELVNNLKNKGLYKNNRIVESQEALDEMAKYTMYEIQNKGAYKKTKERFLSNPDISQNDAAEVLGRDFIRWDMDGKHIKNVADHKRRRDNFYNKLNTNQYKTTEIKASKETEEQTPYISPIDFNTPEYSGMTFSEEEPEQEQTPQEQSLQASQDLLEESFLEEADAMLAQSQTQQEQPIQEYAPAPQYNVELAPIEYQPIAQFQSGGKFAELDAKMAKTRSQLNKSKTPQLNLKERPKEVVRENTQTIFRNEAGRQVNTNPNQQISTKHINERRTESQIIADRKKAIDESIKAQDESIIGSPNWRQTLATQTQSTGDKFRIFPNEDSFIDNYLNPAVMVGDMARNLGQAPLQAQQQDSYMPYTTSIGAPLAVGAMAGYGAKGNGQFVNNLVNPLAGTEEITNKGIRLVHYSDNPHLRLEDIDLFRPGISQRKRSMQSKSTEELPGGFYTTMDENSKFMGGNLGYEMYIPENSKILDLASTGRVTDRLPIKELQQYKKEGYDLIKGRNMLRQDEYIPLNKEKLTGWSQFTQDRRGLNKMQEGGQIPISSRGVYDFPNQEVIVPTEDGKITMKNIDYPIIGTDEFGNRQLMQPNGEYQFPGKIIHEIPQTKRLKNKRFK